MTIWQLAMKLSTLVYQTTQTFPQSEMFGLVSQMRRSVISIPSNIAEGSGRSSDKDFARFLDIAIASSFELETQIEIAYRLNYIEEDLFNTILENCSQLQKMIYSFRKNIQNINQSNQSLDS
ncbi:MAG: four helix bundle protein [Chitinophagales bacterium]|nr:four helix bundle protein [Chitinophagales bacterium]